MVKDSLSNKNTTGYAFLVEKEKVISVEVEVKSEKPNQKVTPKQNRIENTNLEESTPIKKNLDQQGNNELAENKTELAEVKNIKKETPEFNNEKNLVADNSQATIQPKQEGDYVPIKEFAKTKIKNDLLKGKTFTETVIEEIAEASNDKISFERKKDDSGNTQKFAINIGKFSFSKNK